MQETLYPHLRNSDDSGLIFLDLFLRLSSLRRINMTE